MTVRETEAKSLLRKHKRVDSWFVSRYGMNLYRGCTHNCVYCDGRAEGYYVEGEFGKDITVKTNAAEILRRELDPARKRVHLKPGLIIVGGGVGDSYQPLEEKYQLTRKALEVIEEFGFPVHMLTKSTLIERDIDILKRINKKNRAIVSFSMSSASDNFSAVLEPGVPPPSRRLETLTRFKKEGIPCGVFLLPVVPLITDKPAILDESVRKVKEAGADFIVFGAMTLKEGRQKDYFLNAVENHFPGISDTYPLIYRPSKYGSPAPEYIESLNTLYGAVLKRYRIPGCVPARLYRNMLDENDFIAVMLDQIDYLLSLRNQRTPYGYAAYSISQLDKPLSAMRTEISGIKGVGKFAHNIIREILDTGKSSYYEQLLTF